VYWDYIAKGGLQPHEKRDEPTAGDVLRHMIDVHIPRQVWKERPATFVIGGTSTSYASEFDNWVKGCGTHNKFKCPWRTEEGGRSASVVIKGPGIKALSTTSKVKGFTKGDPSEEACYKQRYEVIEPPIREKAIRTGYGYIDLVNVSKGIWSQLRPGDSKGCACHYCVHSSQQGKEPGEWRSRVSGSVCANLANILANELCDGKREELPNTAAAALRPARH
jgi:hypothetical protein